jgi:DNA-binding response OmpR family regulator
MHVLIVEDDARLRRLLSRLLSVDRHVVEEAQDGRTALELARMADGLDALILDIGLPDRSGLEVARELSLSPIRSKNGSVGKRPGSSHAGHDTLRRRAWRPAW